MCGIIYYKSFTGESVNRRVLKHYFRQKQRGHEGFGFVGISEKRLMIHRATKERGIRKYLKNPHSEILFHHRLPTSTSNTLKTTHPIVISQPIYNHRYYFVHNGVIQNDTELKAKHERMGIIYTTSQFSQYRGFWGSVQERYEFNDSEALAHEVALFLEGKQKGIEARGDVAFICLETDRDNNALKLHFARNSGSPLEMKRNSSCLVIASEHVSDQDIPPNRLYTYDYRTQNISQRDIELPECRFFNDYTFSFPDACLYQLNEVEISIQEYEAELCQLEDAQLRASEIGDTVRCQRLQRKKEEIGKQLEQLYEEWNYLESICFN